MLLFSMRDQAWKLDSIRGTLAATHSSKMTPFVFLSMLFLMLPNILLAFFGC